MSHAYLAKNVIKAGLTAVPQSQSNVPISENFQINDAGRLNILIAIVTGDVTVGTAITAKLQTSLDGGTTWKDAKTVTLAADTTTYDISLNVQVTGDQTYLPLRPLGRIVVSTGSGDTSNVTAVYVCQPVG